MLPSYYDVDEADRTIGLPREPRAAARGLLTALVAAAILIGSGVAGALTLRSGFAPAAAGDPALAAPSAPAPAPASTPAPPRPSATPAEPSTLRQQAAADLPAVRELVGRWVPQLSSKAPGMVVGGVRFDEARILTEFRVLRALYPDAALVRSGDFRSFARGGHWVTVLAGSFASAAEVNAWCDRQRLGPDDCFAKRLSRTGGPSGNTVSRR